MEKYAKQFKYSKAKESKTNPAFYFMIRNGTASKDVTVLQLGQI